MPIGSLHRRKWKTNLAILLAVMAWIAMIWGLTMVKMATPAKAQAEYPVPATYKICAQDADCVVASSSCNGCCQQVAINASYLERYAAERNKYCSGYQGGVCDCISLPVEAFCQAGTCDLRSPPSTTGEQNDQQQ